MKVLLVYPPFCTPASPPYSITNLYSFLKNNSKEDIEVLDINLEFHKLKFPEYQKYYQEGNWDDYEKTTKKYKLESSKVYSENNKKVLNNQKPEFFEQLLKLIKDKKPDLIAFSIVYSSQAFYTAALLKELKNTVIGGPAVNDKLKALAKTTLTNEIDLLEEINQSIVNKKELNFNFPTDFSIYNLKEYFTNKPVIPLKTSSSCYYKKCAFCSHFDNNSYFEFPLETIKQTILESKQKFFFLVDDMIPVNRLLELAKTFKPLNIKWACQLKPTKEYTKTTLKTLRDSGLTMIMWGVESASQRILNLINKGTIVEDIKEVLNNSSKADIKNIAYILFGFPTETKEEFIETIDFLKENKESIDLVSVSIFGLQKNTPIYNNPENYQISKIKEEPRTVLPPKITYKTESGLSQDQASKLRQKYKKTLNSINSYPNTMNFFREHMFSSI